MMAYHEDHTFNPVMDDCKMVVTTTKGICYIMDACCRNASQEEKRITDEKIMRIFLNTKMRQKDKNLPQP